MPVYIVSAVGSTFHAVQLVLCLGSEKLFWFCLNLPFIACGFWVLPCTKTAVFSIGLHFYVVPSLQQNIHIKTLADDMVRCLFLLFCVSFFFLFLSCFFPLFFHLKPTLRALLKWSDRQREIKDKKKDKAKLSFLSPSHNQSIFSSTK